MNSHYDGWGNATLGYFEMLKYYDKDHQSLIVLRNNPPYRYAVIPTVRIVVDPLDLLMFHVERAYPGGVQSICINGGLRTLEALRRLWGRPEVTWRKKKENGRIIFTHEGKVIVIRAGKSPWASPREARS